MATDHEGGNLLSSAKYLAERGLDVSPLGATGLRVRHGDDRSLELRELADGFELCSWEYDPGPGEDDFRFPVASLDELLLATWAFYFAKPVEFDGWRLGLHRRPFWSLAGVQYALAQAPHVDAQALMRIAEERSRRARAHASLSGNRLPFAMQTQFLIAGVHASSGARLMVRRDLAEAYVVRE